MHQACNVFNNQRIVEFHSSMTLFNIVRSTAPSSKGDDELTFGNFAYQ